MFDLVVQIIIAYLSLSSMAASGGMVEGQSASDFFGELLGDNNLSNRMAKSGKKQAKQASGGGADNSSNQFILLLLLLSLIKTFSAFRKEFKEWKNWHDDI